MSENMIVVFHDAQSRDGDVLIQPVRPVDWDDLGVEVFEAGVAAALLTVQALYPDDWNWGQVHEALRHTKYEFTYVTPYVSGTTT